MRLLLATHAGRPKQRGEGVGADVKVGALAGTDELEEALEALGPALGQRLSLGFAEQRELGVVAGVPGVERHPGEVRVLPVEGALVDLGPQGTVQAGGGAGALQVDAAHEAGEAAGRLVGLEVAGEDGGGGEEAQLGLDGPVHGQVREDVVGSDLELFQFVVLGLALLPEALHRLRVGRVGRLVVVEEGGGFEDVGDGRRRLGLALGEQFEEGVLISLGGWGAALLFGPRGVVDGAEGGDGEVSEGSK